eukprot:Protomagalhaensia_sp_Gyna_25__158@NODE_1075_length_2222_cov_8_790655_g855_i0_p1_GENE_NODE_1075_length_2222_cov_8_790655_g855_i0NODE_1075_length_2222_cov_8_790655_g855_i0_p1_ORF_typecomplete_len459_score64_60KAP/PF05804_12/1_1e05KAP/PF05804_12/43Arm_2/PF04826_13/9_8e06Arm_2/PF04826_13/3_7e02Arm_2/PF04826_13/1_9e03RTTN_N/PF14726_6/0_14RTTN_N/PF14726_6/8_2e03RTTN_N/PF14726_6/2_1e03RTTN_N/PF14726_6/3Arm/PF00514_23/0_094Arm/PF00514_23/4_1e02Arm/PF00514_23/4_9e03Arm/PF00514_23/3_6Cnd1/PF12717_7/0_14Cn
MHCGSTSLPCHGPGSGGASPRSASRLNRLLTKTKGLRLLRLRHEGPCSAPQAAAAAGEAVPPDLDSPLSRSSASWCSNSLESTTYGGSRSGSEDEKQQPQRHQQSANKRRGREPKGLCRSPGSISSAGGREARLLEDLFALLQSPDSAVREQALATIFHLAQFSPSTRDSILEAGGAEPLLREIQRNGPAEAQTARALYHLCMGRPLPPFHLIAKILPSLHRLLVTSEEEEVLVIVAYVLNELTLAEDLTSLNYVIKVLPPPLHARLVALLRHPSLDVRFRSLQLLAKTTAADRIHGPLASGSRCEELLGLGLLVPLRKCLGIPELENESVEIVQNLLPHHFEPLMKSEDLIKKYFVIVRSRLGLDARVLGMLKSAVHQADKNQMQFLHECGCNEVLDQTHQDLLQMQQDMDQILSHLAVKGVPHSSGNQGPGLSSSLPPTGVVPMCSPRSVSGEGGD